jgi:choline-sulfatase
VRDGDYKYIYTHSDPPQLFNLGDDPLELNDLSADTAQSERCTALHALLMDGWGPEDVNACARANQAERHFINSITDGEPHWAYEARHGDGERYVRNASAVGTKAKARYPFVNSVPFEN